MTEALTHLTRRAALGVSLGAMAVVACGRDPLAADATQRADLEAVFAESGVAGTFVLYEVEADQLTLIAGERAQTRLVPASTFKIANTIIALETGVVKDENEVTAAVQDLGEEHVHARGDRAVRGSNLSG